MNFSKNFQKFSLASLACHKMVSKYLSIALFLKKLRNFIEKWPKAVIIKEKKKKEREKKGEKRGKRREKKERKEDFFMELHVPEY